MKLPLTLRFKLIALAPQILLEDSSGQLQFYVKQKLLKLKEEVNVFRDEAQSQRAYTIKADRIIDFNANYMITNTGGICIGSVKRSGMKSLWRATYAIENQVGQEAFTVEEEKPWVRVVNGFLEEIPVLGMLSGYVLNPVYLIKRSDGSHVMTLKKQPALFEGRFSLTAVGAVSEEEQTLITLSLLMMTLLERSRG